MSDGTMGIQVAPVQESEMSHIRQIFDRAANAIVQASELAVKVQELSNVVDGLKHDIEYVRLRNRELDEQLATTREQRDNARRDGEQAKSELSTATHTIEGLTSARDSQEQVVQNLNHTLDQTRKERDEYGMDAMKLREELDQVNAKLAKVREAFGIVEPPKPEPAPVYHEPPANPSAYVEPSPALNEPYRSW